MLSESLQTLVQARQPPSPPPPAPVAPQKKRPKRRTDAVSPEFLAAIARERQQHAELTLEAFGEHLFRQRIYRGTGQDGKAKPASKSLIHKWLAEAREAGLLS
jgi:hypothetical protein